MIHTSLSFLTKQINESLKLRTDDHNTERIFLTSVATETGIVIPANSLGLSLINIEEERHFKDQKSTVLNEHGVTEKMNPEIKLNLFILISANFQDTPDNSATNDYLEGLKQLSYVISFFQSKNVFTPENSPLMSVEDPNLRKLIVELYSYSFEQLYNFWSVVGTKYLPSVLYRVRLVRFQEKSIKSTALPIEKIGINSHGANYG